MAREVKVGIVITAKNATAATFRAVGTSAAAAGKAVQAMARSIETSMKASSLAVTGLNQGMELAGKAMRAFETLIGSTVAKALEFRTAGDAAGMQFQALARSVELVRARIGDALLPALQGLATAFDPAVRSAEAWLATNQRIIASNVVEYTARMARILVEGVAFGALFVARAWNGWLMIINLVRAGVESFFGYIIEGTGGIVGALGSLASALGMDGVQGKLQGLSASMQGLADEFHGAASSSVDATMQAASSLQTMEAQISSVKAKVLDLVEQGYVVGMAKARVAIAGGTRSLEEQRLAAERMDAIQAKIAALEEMRQRRLAEIREANTLRQQELLSKTAETADSGIADMESRIKSLTETSLHLIVESFATMEAGAESFGETTLRVMGSIGKAVANAALGFIIAKAAEGAAAAFKGAIEQFGPWGLVIGAGLAAAAFAGIYALTGKVQKFEKGGVATGGIPGKDSVFALMTPGERALTPRQTDSFERFVAIAERAMSGGGGGAPAVAAAAGGGVTVNLSPSWQTVAPPSQAETKRFLINNLKPAIEELMRDGLWPRAA